MNKIKKFLNNYKFKILVFFLPIFICLFIFLTKGYIIKKTIFQSDMMGQYVSFFSYYKNVLTGKENIFYSFSKGIGGSMIGAYSYYLSSPLNLLIIFFPLKALPLFFVVLLLLKIGLSSLTMYIYLDYLNKENNYLKIALSVCYGMMAYITNYYFNIMWLDGVYLLPLVIMGIDKIFNEKSPILYLVALCLSIWCNYYIGFMICIFSCLYFIYKFILMYKEIENRRKKVIFRFLFTSLLAGLMTAIILIPTILELQNSNKSLNTFFTTTFNINLNIFDFLSKGYIGSYNKNMILNTNTVNWYLGIMPIILLINYFFNKEISRKEKILSVIMILIFITSFSVSHINYIWHGFNIPVGFNYRYSFIFCFLVVTLAFKGFNKFNLNKTKILISLIIYILIAIIILLLDYEYIKFYLIWLSVGLFVIYEIILSVEINVDIEQKKMLHLLFILLVISEMSVNFYFVIRDYDFYYNSEYNYNLKEYGKINKYDNDGLRFKRIETYNDFTSNNGLMANYNGISSFISTINKKLVDFGSDVGLSYSDLTIDYGNGNTPIIDSILGLKYIFSIDNNKTLYNKKETYKFKIGSSLLFGLCNIDAFVYENPYMLNLGFMVSNESINFNNKLKKLENMNNFEYQNLMFQTMNNSKKRYLESYKMVNFDIEKLIYEYEINNDKDFYLYFPTMFNNGHKSSVNIYLNNKLIGTYTTTSRNVIHIKNSFKNEKVKIKLKLNDGGIAGIPFLYYLNDQYFIEDVKKLQEKQLDITYFSDTYIKGNINATKDNNIMFLSIPYEDGWHVYVDGKEAKKELLYNTFIGVKLKEGKHEIEMKYKTPGLMIGIIISSISLVMVIIYSKLISKKIN